MSGSNTTQSGEAVTALPVASAVEQDDVVLGIVGGVLVQLPVKVATSGSITASSGGTLAAPILTGNGYAPAAVSSGGSVVTNPNQLARMADVTAAVTSATAPLAGAVTSAQAFASQSENFANTTSGLVLASQQAAGQSGVSATAADTSAKVATQMSQSAANFTNGVGPLLAQFQSLLAAAQNGNLPAGAAFRGFWNASTNTPALASGTGAAGDIWLVSNAGSTALDGTDAWSYLDAAIFTSGGTWQRLARAGATIANAYTALESITAGGVTLAPWTQNGFTLKTLIGYILARVDAEGNAAFAGETLQTGTVTRTILSDTAWAYSMRDLIGRILWGILQDGSPMFPGAQAQIGPMTLTPTTNGGFRIKNADGFVVFDTTGTFSTPEAFGFPEFSEASIASRDAENAARSASVMAMSRDDRCQRPTAAYNLVIDTGQSEEEGYISLPALSTTQPYDNLMIGQAAHCVDPNPTDSAWVAVGGTNTLNPLIATNYDLTALKLLTRPGVQLVTYSPANVTVVPGSDNSSCVVSTTDSTVDFTSGFQVDDFVQMTGFTGSAVSMNQGNANGQFNVTGYTQVTAVTAQSLTLGSFESNFHPVAVSAVAGITIAILWGSVGNRSGEENGVSAMNAWRRRQLAWRGLESDPSRLLVYASTCVGDQTLAMLSKGANPPIYNRIPQVAQILQDIASAAGKTCCVTLVPFLQGGSDATTSYETYLAELKTFHADVCADVMAITGQKWAPFFEMAILSGANLNMYDQMGVARAQLDFGLNTPGVYVVGAGYPGARYYAHWSPNTERAFGAQRAKVRHRVVDQGLNWQPLHPVSFSISGCVVLIDFHVPVGKLQVLPVVVDQIEVLWPDLGFSMMDTVTGESFAVASAEIVGTATVRLILNSVPKNPSVPVYASGDWPGQYGGTYGNGGHIGTGNLFDTDPTLSDDPYLWTPGAGQPFTEQDLSPAGVGNPMPLFNPCVPFCMTLADQV